MGKHSYQQPPQTREPVCYIGSYGAHTLNAERDECIWCGPNLLAKKPGKWVSISDDPSSTAWQVNKNEFSTTTTGGHT